MTKNTKNKFTIASLFAGCGGLDLGFIGGFESNGKKYSKHPFSINWANDIDESACKTFRNYFKHDIVCGSIVDILNDKHNAMFDVPLPECQAPQIPDTNSLSFVSVAA